MTLFKKVSQLSAIIVLISALFCFGKGSVKSANDIDLVHFNSAMELARSIRRGEITSVDLLNLYLDRIQRYNDDINAVVALDITGARARAAEADRVSAIYASLGAL